MATPTSSHKTTDAGSASQPSGQSRSWMRLLFQNLLLSALLVLVVVTAALGLVQQWRAAPLNPVPSTLSGQDLITHLNSLDEAGISALETYALEKLRQNSLDPEALQYLGIVAGLRKNTSQQERLALNAARLSQRDPRTQLAAFAIALQKQNFTEALYQLDGMLRARPELEPQFFPVLSSIILRDDALVALAKTLAALPPWREKFIDYQIAQPDGWRTVLRLFRAMRDGNGRPSNLEMSHLLTALAQRRDYEQAYFVWLDALDENALARVEGVFDGGFDLDPHNQLFDWNIRPAKNALVSVESRPGSSVNRALKVDLFGHKGRFSDVYQYLRLPSGQYTMRYDVMVQSLKGPNGLAWRLRCPDDNKILAETKEISTVGPWSTTNLIIAIPTDCTTQVLQLETAAYPGSEPMLTGTFLFDDMKIEPLEASAPAPEGKQE